MLDNLNANYLSELDENEGKDDEEEEDQEEGSASIVNNSDHRSLKSKERREEEDKVEEVVSKSQNEMNISPLPSSPNLTPEKFH